MFDESNDEGKRGRARMVVAVVATVILLGLIFFIVTLFTAPAHGEPVAIPASLDKAIRNHLYESKQEGIHALQGYHCDTFRWGNIVSDRITYVVEVDTGSDKSPNAVFSDLGRWYKVLVSSTPKANTENPVIDGWELTVLHDLRLTNKSFEPCVR